MVIDTTTTSGETKAAVAFDTITVGDLEIVKKIDGNFKKVATGQIGDSGWLDSTLNYPDTWTATAVKYRVFNGVVYFKIRNLASKSNITGAGITAATTFPAGARPADVVVAEVYTSSVSIPGIYAYVDTGGFVRFGWPSSFTTTAQFTITGSFPLG
ncbi:hypothetical protein COC69_05700 [Bacillus cereus]|uniref:Uncharacterized protein n=1 Tax=Bacillus cereus TaxID=1396 RepID=A0A9X7GX74_BACCE|nr:hypothetical protein [Bacillus cereus]PGS81624.1 hypothetical protein COC69_05700 [Bacillus cereus]